MEIFFNPQLYSRCYPREEDQYSDVVGNPLYSLLPIMTTSQNKIHAGTWTSIDSNEIIIKLAISSPKSSILTLAANNNLLESFEFPKSIKKEKFKIQFKSTSVGVRYERESSIRLFQISFSSDFQCQLFFEQMSRFGVLGPGCWDSLYISCFCDSSCDSSDSSCDSSDSSDNKKNSHIGDNTIDIMETDTTDTADIKNTTDIADIKNTTNTTDIKNSTNSSSTQESIDFSFMTPTALQ